MHGARLRLDSLTRGSSNKKIISAQKREYLKNLVGINSRAGEDVNPTRLGDLFFVKFLGGVFA
jgi:hypothetical protein